MSFRFSSLLLPAALCCSVLLQACSDNDQPTVEQPDPTAEEYAYSGGATTVQMASSHAYSQPAPNLSAQSLALHFDGDRSFEQTFVTAPATANAGLGPMFNNTSCISCHVRDGRGRPPMPGEEAGSMLLRISMPGVSAHGGPAAVPGYGNQLQTRAIVGSQPKGRFSVAYSERIEYLQDGTPVSLRVPSYNITNTWTALPAGVLVSPRIAPPVFGLGLLEAVDEAEVLRLADETDANGDGISGRPNYVWDVAAGRPALGRFGWKANQPSLLQQAAAAYNGDMGITTSMFPQENCDGIPGCNGSPTPDIDDETLRATVFYTQTLAVPASRNTNDTRVRKGRMLFANAGCASCHRPSMRTGTHKDAPELSGQKFSAFTDLLLHDMGSELADNRPDFLATGREWRTAPLWGIGLTRIVNGYEAYLHDGRARTVLEAIMWHGGEGAASREYVRKLSADERNALLAFIASL